VHEQDEKMLVMKDRVVKQIQQGDAIPALAPAIEVTACSLYTEHNTISFADTILYDAAEGEEEPFRQLTVHTSINGRQYIIVIRNSRLESHDFFEIVFMPIGVILLVLLVILYLINTQLSKQIWKPFYNQINKVKAFSLAGNNTLHLENTTIQEFNDLKNVLETLTKKIKQDYNTLKTFTENASHEIQTPLSIIQSKIEMLMQDNKLEEQDIAALQAIYASSRRLSKLNEGLLLLTKIENNQFTDAVNIKLNEQVKMQTAYYKELAEMKQLYFVITEKADFTVHMNAYLADIMIKNLIENAIRYSEGNVIKIDINTHQIIFSNSGNSEIIHPEEIFQRFYTSSVNKQSMGLGLAIVKDICLKSNLHISYRYKDTKHHFIIEKK